MGQDDAQQQRERAEAGDERATRLGPGGRHHVPLVYDLTR